MKITRNTIKNLIVGIGVIALTFAGLFGGFNAVPQAQAATFPQESYQPAVLLDAVNQQMLEAAKKTIPSVVTVIGIEKLPAPQQIDVEQFLDDNPIFRQLGYNSSNLRIIPEGPKAKVMSGSGFIASHNGYILTNNHVVANLNATYKVVFYDGSEMPAEVVYRDPVNDIALLKVNGTYNTIATFGDSSSLELGQNIASIGNAYGQQRNSVALGSISSLNTDIVAGNDQNPTEPIEHLSGVIESNAQIVPGYSGGPVIDTNGSVVGMNVAASATQSFLIPANTIKGIVKKFAS